MQVIADASTLIALSRIGQLTLLSELYGQVIIPRAVYDEVAGELKAGSKEIKKARYFKVEDVQDKITVELLLGSFGRGEAEVLALAREDQADIILIDESKARKVARRAGFTIIGVLGILVMAKKKGFIPSVKPLIEELFSQGFRLSEKVIKRTLREAGELNI